MNFKFEILNQVLPNFFTENEVLEIKMKLKSASLVKQKSGIKLNNNTKYLLKQTRINSGRTYFTLLLSIVKSKLSKSKLSEFLFGYGEILMANGEFDFAKEVFIHILNLTHSELQLVSLRAYTLLTLGNIFSRQAEWEQSIKFIKNAKIIFTAEKDYRGCARCENLLGTIYGDKSNIGKTKLHFEKSLSYLDPKKDFVWIGIIEMNVGIINSIQGNYNDAMSYFKRALLKFEHAKDFRRISELRNNLSIYFINKGDFNSALNELDISIALHNKTEFLPNLVISYVSKSYIYAIIKDYIFASAYIQKSMSICKKINDRLSIAELYKIKGIIYRNKKKYSYAEKFFNASLKINNEFDNKMNEAETFYEMGYLYSEMGKKPESIRNWKKSLQYYKKIKHSNMISKIESLLKPH